MIIVWEDKEKEPLTDAQQPQRRLPWAVVSRLLRPEWAKRPIYFRYVIPNDVGCSDKT